MDGPAPPFNGDNSEKDLQGQREKESARLALAQFVRGGGAAKHMKSETEGQLIERWLVHRTIGRS